nr:probable F-box protein At4g22030 [Setaria viridis]
MEGLLQSQVGAAPLPAATRPHIGRKNRLPCARASVRGGVRQLALSIDELRLARDAVVAGGADDHAVNGHAPAGGKAAEKLRAVAEAAADRAEMHDIIGRQRDNWNHLLLHSTNSLTLAASVMAALAPAAPSMVALKASAGVLLATAAVTMAAVNKIQPSQLAEEQRNATRLWRQLERDVRAALDCHGATPAATEAYVQDAMDRVLALDAAYPLPLLPGMLDKFPKTLEPTRWWPKRQVKNSKPANNGTRRGATAGNGWTQDLEDEMRGIVRVLRAKDEQEYVTAGKRVLAVNRVLAVAGPALAAAANTVEHGGQLGMLFELCRNVSGFYRKVQEDIEACLDEADVERRENGEVFEAKVALLLGRSTSDLRQFREMASPSFKDEDMKDFAGKLF